MIAYLDSSAIVPLLIAEATSDRCRDLANGADRLVTANLAYPEVRAALAAAQRAGRLTKRQRTAAVGRLDDLQADLDLITIVTPLARRAGELAEALALRGYDAIHLAAAEAIADERVVLVSGDRDLIAAGQALGLAVADTSA